MHQSDDGSFLASVAAMGRPSTLSEPAPALEHRPAERHRDGDGQDAHQRAAQVQGEDAVAKQGQQRSVEVVVEDFAALLAFADQLFAGKKAGESFDKMRWREVANASLFELVLS